MDTKTKQFLLKNLKTIDKGTKFDDILKIVEDYHKNFHLRYLDIFSALYNYFKETDEEIFEYNLDEIWEDMNKEITGAINNISNVRDISTYLFEVVFRDISDTRIVTNFIHNIQDLGDSGFIGQLESRSYDYLDEEISKLDDTSENAFINFLQDKDADCQIYFLRKRLLELENIILTQNSVSYDDKIVLNTLDRINTELQEQDRQNEVVLKSFAGLTIKVYFMNQIMRHEETFQLADFTDENILAKFADFKNSH